jgi:hypothetical protein
MRISALASSTVNRRLNLEANYDLSAPVTREKPRHLTAVARRVLRSAGEGTGISDKEATVSFMSSAKWRRLIPAGAVATVLALSYLAPLPSEASNGQGGFGYNCGVKGYGYHDHGKPCPNRPFPGEGQGVENSTAGDEGPATTSSQGVVNSTAGDEGPATTSSQDTENATPSQGTSHGHGHGKSKGHGN